MQANHNLDLPVREVILPSKYDNRLAYISVSAFLVMGATMLVILSL